MYYRLRQPEIAAWLMGATRSLEHETVAAMELRAAIDNTRELWPAR